MAPTRRPCATPYRPIMTNLAHLFSPELLTTLLAGFTLSLATIMALGPQNVHVIRMGLLRQQVLTTVLTCTFADIVLVAFGVWGLSHIGGLNNKLEGAMIGAGALFLTVYGWQAARRFVTPLLAHAQQAALGEGALFAAGAAATAFTKQRAVMTALGFSLLNPHAWIDTTVVIGTASLAYGAEGAIVFGVGAIVGSAFWFSALGIAVSLLGRRMQSARLWHWLDGAVALMMWGTAAVLLSGLT